MEDGMFSDTMTVTDIDADQGAPWFRISLLPRIKLSGWLNRVEDKIVLDETGTSRTASDGARDLDQYPRMSFGQSRVYCYGQDRLLCQAIVAQLLQSH